jgi:hypothetical protein
MPKSPRNRALQVRVTREGVLTIEIGIDTLAFSALRAPFAFDAMGPKQELPDTRFSVTNARGFAADVKRALTDELGEDGSSLITNVIDKACETAVEDGSQHWRDALDSLVDDDSDNVPTDPAEKFGERAAQVSVPVLVDVKIARIAEQTRHDVAASVARHAELPDGES